MAEVQAFTFLFQSLNIPLPSHTFSTFAILITTLTTFLANINFTRDLLKNPNPLPTDPPQTFDFIIVGAGSAGSVIANRLSANGLFSVLLLEAGGDPLILNDIPYLVPSGTVDGHSETDWMYKTVPQRHAGLSFLNRTFSIPRGKSVGGTSNLNGLNYMRGNPNDFDNWAQLTQDNQWTYDNLLPFFKKIENYKGNFPNPKYHGSNGPIVITPIEFHPLVADWLNAGIELGFPVLDPNARQTSSFYPLDASEFNGVRWEQYRGYILPALERRNFKLIRYARVTQINLDSNNIATGVTYLRNEKKFTVFARKEVILCAGSIGSPHLLMLSGIGPSHHLQSVGIEPKVDLPGVGQNLMDHTLVYVGPFILNAPVSFIPERDMSIETAKIYLKNRTGVISHGTVSTGSGMTSTTGEPLWPNIQISFSPAGISENLLAAGSNNVPGLFQTYYKGFVGRDALTISVGLVRPKSVGSITLKSSDPFDDPLIDPDYFADPADVKAMIEGFKFAIKTQEETRPFQKYNSTLIPNHLPGCEAFPLRTDAYYECFIRHMGAGNNHPSATCKMGHVNDLMAVVDSNLRVKHVQGLRVADASIMPVITNSNLNAPVTMIGEKAADLILKTWKA